MHNRGGPHLFSYYMGEIMNVGNTFMRIGLGGKFCFVQKLNVFVRFFVSNKEVFDRNNFQLKKTSIVNTIHSKNFQPKKSFRPKKKLYISGPVTIKQFWFLSLFHLSDPLFHPCPLMH
jgi:hypothetical protein